jgi:FMN phosphatase YigB (HAD superfamily)
MDKNDVNIKAIIFDWGRTLFDSETKKEFFDAEKVLQYCQTRGYRLVIASLVSVHANATLEERILQIGRSPLRKFFEMTAVTDKDKDTIFDEIVGKLNLPRSQILIVDDRTVRGIKYGNEQGHPTVWFQNGKFANELPDGVTGSPTFTIHSLNELLKIV